MEILKKISRPIDMTTGKPWEKILFFAMPMLIGNIAQQLYNAVDSAIVGKYVGDNALAAVGGAGPILNLLIALFIGIGAGAGITVSQCFGAHKRDELSKLIGSCIFLVGMASLFIMTFASLVARPMLILLNTPESIIDWSHSYLLILFIGSSGAAFFNILSGVLRGLGDSVSGLLYLLISSVIHIVLDLLFVKQFHMGVNGVALATVLSQGVSAVLCIRKLRRMTDFFDFKISYIKWNKKYASSIIRLGLPSGVTQMIMSMAMIIVQSLTNSYGEMFIAANVMVTRVDGFAMLPNTSFGNALTTYAGQNMGAGSYERVEKGAKQGCILAVATSAIITLAILIFGRSLMGIFTDTESLIDLSMSLMRIMAAGYIAMAIIQTLSGAMRGAGDTMTPMWISILVTFVIRVPLAYGLTYLSRSPELPNGNREYIYISLLISWVLGAIINLLIYRKGKWKNRGIR